MELNVYVVVALSLGLIISHFMFYMSGYEYGKKSNDYKLTYNCDNKSELIKQEQLLITKRNCLIISLVL